jgi:TPR repeat protein
MKNTSFVSPLAFWARAVGAASTEVAVIGAVKAYDRGDYAHALVPLTELAESGSSKAQHYLARMYANGEGVEQDAEAAIAWYLEAAHGGYPAAQERLGHVYADGDLGVAADSSLAFAWLDIAAAAGNVEAAKARDMTAAGMGPVELKRGRSLSIELTAKPLYLLDR